MSTTEDVIHRTILEPQCSEPDVAEGACGGVEGLRPTTPYSDDNLSMEVRFSEGSSRHASDISDVSYQNLLEDKDIPGPNLSRRESEDSVDSYLPDYCDELAHDQEMMDMSSQQTSSYSDKISDRISIRMTDDHIHILTDESKVDKKKICHSVKSDPGSETYKRVHSSEVQGLNKALPLEGGNPISIHDNFRKHELVNLREQQRSRSLPPDDEIKEGVSKKRNSLEIRNNIPVYGEVKNYEKDIENFTYSNQGAKPKIRKQSPGLACRIEDNTENVKKENIKSPNTNGENENVTSNKPAIDSGNGNEKELDHATQIINELIQVSKANALALNAQTRKETQQKETPVITNGVMNPVQLLDPDAFPIQKQTDVENEYEYVKYSRIQEGNSYVGMRLAYSSSEGGEDNSTVNGGDQSNINLESPQEGTPEQASNLVNTSHRSGNVNEDALTEIPLNGPGENSTVIDEYKIFTLSPENTECDSVEIESVTSEGDDDKSPSGMPNVEDGLSSSQTSDIEDNNTTEQNTPTKQLHQRQQQEIERKLYGIECDKMKPKEIDAEAIIDDLKLKREALDSAIADIKTAIQKSKGIALEAPYNEDADSVDPIWIKRDEEKVIPRGQSTHEVIHSREEFERRRNIELASREHEKVYHCENEKERLLENLQTEGRVYQTPKGYDSDDEYDEIDNVHYTRRIKGKKYSQLPKDDSMVHSETSQYADGDVNLRENLSHVRIVDSVSMYSDSNSFAYAQDSHSDRRNSESQYSSEDYCSDNEVPTKNAYVRPPRDGDFDTDEETDQLLEKQYQGNQQYVDIPELTQPPVNRSAQAEKRQSKAKEVQINDPENPAVLIEGVLFRARYLGSTQLISEGQPSKAMRMMQAQEAVGRIKAPEGENQPSTEVDLFVSTEKIMVLNTDLQEIMMDHSLRTISYIADIGEILVIMARRRLMGSPGDTDSMRRNKQSKILCHVFETDEAQLIAQSIGQAFQVAYMEFLKANGIEDPGLMKEIDYQDVLNQQEIYGEELNLFANKEMHKEVIVPKLKGELLGVVIVESGWGSMVPTVVLANMSPTGPSARCGQLNIGDQIISVNGISLVGLPLSTCQTYIKSAKAQTVVKLTVVPCPPVVEVCIKRPDVKYQLGFSVQNGVICSLLRGGIAERGGVRVGHRIIEINNQSVVAVPHEKIVTLLANSVGEIHMKTMPTSIFRLLTGQETPHYL